MTEALTDRIYEAAFVPELWPGVLEEMATLANSMGAAIFVFADGKPTKGRALDSQRELLDEFLASDTAQFSTGVTRMCSVQPASFIDVDTFLTAEEIANDPLRIQYRSLGIGTHLCTAIPMPSGELAIFMQQRRLADGLYHAEEIGRLNALRPHLARASLIAARLGLDRARSTVSTFEVMGLPAAVLASSGRVLASNALLDAASSVFRPVAFGGMAIADGEANRLFQAAVTAARSGIEPMARSIPVPPKEDQSALVIHVMPLRRSAHDIFTGGDVLIAATAVSASKLVPAPNILTGLFDLTPAEARLAAALAAGRTLKDAATDSGITFKSGRTYLERIFAKTGTRRQSELVALLRNAHPLPAAPD